MAGAPLGFVLANVIANTLSNVTPFSTVDIY